MAGALIGALRVTLGIDTAAFEEGLGIAQKRLNAAGRNLQQIGDRMAGLGQTLSIGVTAPLVAFGASAFKAASDAAELQSAFDQTFGDMAADMTAWAEATGDAMGRSTQSIQEAANTFGIFFNQAAPTRQEAAEMSKTFAVLAQDLASFYNVAESDALQKLRSGLSGESEPLRDFGVFLTEANVKAKALELGLGSLGGELSEQDKIMARYALILEATSNAQGDVARTSEGTANQMRAAQAAFQELQVTVGTKLIPVLTPLITKLAGILDAFSGLSEGTQTFIVAAAAIAAAVGPVLFALGSLVSAVGALAPVFAPLVTVVGAAFGAGGVFAGAFSSLSAFGSMLSLVAGAAAPVLAPLAAVAAVGALIWANWDKIGPVLAELRDKFVAALGPKLTALVDTVKTKLTELWNGPFGEAIRWVINVLGEFGAAYTSVMGEALIRVISAAVDIVAGAFSAIIDSVQLVIAVLTGDWAGAWEAAKSLVSNAINTVLNVLNSLAPGAGDAVRALATRLWEGLTQIVNDMLTIGRNIVQGLVNGIRANAEAVWNALRSVVMAGVDRIRDFLGIRSPSLLFMEMGGFITEGLAIGITDGLGDVETAMDALGATVADGLSGVSAGAGISLDPSFDVGSVGADAGNSLRDNFRQSFSEGIKAALEGDLSKFFQNWFERIGTRSFENILNSVADEFANLLSGLFGQTGGTAGSGGLGGVLAGVLGSIFGGTPGFALGGSFTVGGSPGRDANLVAFRATRGEKVTISNDDADGSASGMPGTLQFNFYGPVTNPEQVRRSAAQAGAHLLRMSAAGKRGI